MNIRCPHCGSEDNLVKDSCELGDRLINFSYECRWCFAQFNEIFEYENFENPDQLRLPLTERAAVEKLLLEETENLVN